MKTRPSTIYEIEQSIVKSIEIEHVIYGKSFIHVNFDTSVDDTIIKACIEKLKLISESASNMDVMRVSFPSRDVRAVLDMLFVDALISAAERSAIEDSVRKKEQEDKQSSKTKDAKMTVSQKDVLHEMIKPYLDAIISLPLKPDAIVILLTYAFSKDFRESYLHESLINYLMSLKLERAEIIEIMDHLKCLATILLGYANLESTFERCGQAIPALKNQREMIAAVCLTELNKKFTALSLHDRFCFAMEIFMMTCQQQYSMSPGHNQKILQEIFAGSWEGRNLHRSFAHFGGFSSLVLKAIWHENFADDEIAIINESIAGSYLSEIIHDNFKLPLSAESNVESVNEKQLTFR